MISQLPSSQMIQMTWNLSRLNQFCHPECLSLMTSMRENDGDRYSTSQIFSGRDVMGVPVLSPKGAKVEPEKNEEKKIARDIGVIMDSSAPHGSWPLGKVLEETNRGLCIL